MSIVTEMYEDGFTEGYNQALEDVLILTATLGIDWDAASEDIDWLEKSIENLKR